MSCVHTASSGCVFHTKGACLYFCLCVCVHACICVCVCVCVIVCSSSGHVSVCWYAHAVEPYHMISCSVFTLLCWRPKAMSEKCLALSFSFVLLWIDTLYFLLYLIFLPTLLKLKSYSLSNNTHIHSHRHPHALTHIHRHLTQVDLNMPTYSDT